MNEIIKLICRCDKCEGSGKIQRDKNHYFDLIKCFDCTNGEIVMEFKWSDAHKDESPDTFWWNKDKELFIRFELDQPEPQISIVKWSEDAEHPNITESLNPIRLESVEGVYTWK